ncbi:MAG TPA: hypothetical protein VK183_00995 [Flavobacterium sp.]|nr:hypothetical protein [Flavobacterium sp.]
MKNLKYLVGSFAFITILSSCSNDNSAPVNEEEVITTVTITLTPQGGGNAIILKSQDLDGDGPNAPTLTVSGNLAAGAVYNGSIDLLNELETPAESITAEIEEEALDHQFFFTLTNNTGTVAYAAPFDSNSNPIGINFTVTAGTAGSGTFTAVLRHQPDKAAEGVSSGNITNAGGETDVQVSFPIVVQ